MEPGIVVVTIPIESGRPHAPMNNDINEKPGTYVPGFCCRDDWIRTSDHTPPDVCATGCATSRKTGCKCKANHSFGKVNGFLIDLQGQSNGPNPYLNVYFWLHSGLLKGPFFPKYGYDTDHRR